MNEWLAALFSLLGVALGAGLQLAASRVADRARHGEELQSQAYADYLRAVAAAGHLTSEANLADARRNAADAKARIAVYGVASVIQALAGFEKAGAALTHPAASAAFIKLVRSMRRTRGDVDDKELELVLLGVGRHDD